MSKLHITLAENMSRFGTKNLTEANKRSLQYLAEQGDTTNQKSGTTEDPVIISAVQLAGKLPLSHQPGEKPTGGAGYLTVLNYMVPTSKWSYFAPVNPGPVLKYVNGILSSLTIDFTKGTLIHKYQYSVGIPKNMSPESMFKTSNLFMYTKTYTFKKDVADVTRMYTELGKAMQIIIDNGPQLNNKTTVTDTPILTNMKSAGYLITNSPETVG